MPSFSSVHSFPNFDMKPVEILPSGRPAFLQGEVEVSVVPTVEVDQLPNERFLLRLTTHRLILQVLF